MGKKKKKVMDEQRELFVKGCEERGVTKKKAHRIFGLMAHFAGYGFNKSHTAAYALITYQTAYLKAHFPVEFMAALLTSDMDNTDRVVKYINECREMHITVLPPDVNVSDVRWRGKGNAVRVGLLAIKSLGTDPRRRIVEKRADQSYRSLTDFLNRIRPEEPEYLTLVYIEAQPVDGH